MIYMYTKCTKYLKKSNNFSLSYMLLQKGQCLQSMRLLRLQLLSWINKLVTNCLSDSHLLKEISHT